MFDIYHTLLLIVYTRYLQVVIGNEKGVWHGDVLIVSSVCAPLSVFGTLHYRVTGILAEPSFVVAWPSYMKSLSDYVIIQKYVLQAVGV